MRYCSPLAALLSSSVLAVAVLLLVTCGTVQAESFTGTETITFEDYGEGTPITDQYESEGIIFSGASPDEPPFVAWDGVSFTNPVLSGEPRFHGTIKGALVVPGSSVPTTVNGLAMDVGYIDDPGSVQLTVTTTTGTETIVADELGFNHLETSAQNIVGFSVEETNYDEEGFEIDNVSFTPGTPPPIVPAPPPPVPPPPAPPAPQTDYAALGDSYSSGEGAPPFESGTNTSQNKCHRSLHAYAYDLRGTLGFPSSLQFSACSGATIANFYPHKGQYNETAGQLATLGATDSVVSLTIGGNDVKFGPLIKSCVVLPACFLTDDLATRDLIKHTVKRLQPLYDEMLKRAPNAQVYVLGYPDFFSPHPSFLCNGVDRLEATWITRMEVLFDAGIRDATKQVNNSRLHYVDTSNAFAGGELCSGHKPVYMNGIIKAHLEYSFHPTALGQQRLAQRLAAAVDR